MEYGANDATTVIAPVVSPVEASRPGRIAWTPDRRRAVQAIGGFALISGLAWIVVAWSSAHLSMSPHEAPVAGAQGLSPWVRGWSHWDANWYETISRDGYSYRAGSQSSVAFFPVYPLAIRFAQFVTPDWSAFARGCAITAVAGLLASGLLFAWCRHRFSASSSMTAVLLLAVYPYSFYLFGAVYADALFLACTLAAFVLMERGHVCWATVVAAVCSVARPAGLIVVLALAWRYREIVRLDARRTGLLPRRLAPVAVAMLGAGGFVAYATYLHQQFRDAFAFASTQASPGWDQGPGPHTWFKVSFFEEVLRAPLGPAALGLMLQLGLALAMLASVPVVRRRLGMSYAVLVSLLVLMPLVASKDFQGTGRYLLPAFPVFAVAGEALTQRPRVRTLVVGVGVGVVLLFSSWFANGNYLA